jgi:lipoprotein-anchoring transpeptidase ErfK/SrfK
VISRPTMSFRVPTKTSRTAEGNRRPAIILAAAAASTLVAVTACTAAPHPHSEAQAAAQTAPVSATSPASQQSPTTPAPPPPAVITAATTAAGQNPAVPVRVAVSNGTLSSVRLIDAQGHGITGSLSSDGTIWSSARPLSYGTTYRLTAKATNSAGTPASESQSFATVQPSNLTMPYLQRSGGYTLDNGATYGVGIVPVVHFDETITDKAAAQRALQVITTPHVAGVWYWADDQDVHFRPETYWPAGTKVTVKANLFGVKVGPGLYGQANASSSFTVGASHVAVADDTTHNVKVYFSGKLMRTMNTSMGQHSGETVKGNYISFFTMDGTYTVLEHDDPAIMSSASYGLPANAPGGYGPEPIYYATKISTDGIYLHELDSTVWAQDNGVDVSHGCLNLNQENAIWYYNHSQIGDVVEIKHNGGPTIQLWQNGDWSVPWAIWKAGSAIK